MAYNLPSLGDSTSSIVSAREEYITGQNWLRAFRREAPISNDPQLYSYIHGLIQNIAFYSPLQNKDFSLVVVNSQDFNAFAVPGNVVGINVGLFNYAETEDEMASVIGHELAHLSQRHYARNLEHQKSQSLATMAALLGSLLIMAAGNADTGMAALTATQAAAMQNQLTFSRSQEEEADRIGMETLANANMNPAAMAHMFQHMLQLTRYRTDLKEFAFLLTHPLTENRVSDALNKARLYPQRIDRDSLQFHLMKARAQYLAIQNPREAVDYFQNMEGKTPFPKANDYGLALALLANDNVEQAAPIINKLYQEQPQLTAFILLKANLLAQQKNTKAASKLLTDSLRLSPANYPLSMGAANLFIKDNQPANAVDILRALAGSGKPDTPDVWYLLSEVEGLSGNIPQVHLARAEYYVRIGALTQAQRHLIFYKLQQQF